MSSTLLNCQKEPRIGSSGQDPEATPPEQADIVLIGGGVIGLSTAWHLLQAGRQPIVLDPHPGSGASFAAAGMLASISEVQYRQEALLPLMRTSAQLYPEFVARLEATSGQSVGWRPTETLVLAFDRADAQHLTELATYQQELGLTPEPIGARAARRHEPVLSPSLAGAVSIAQDHQIDPRRLMRALDQELAGRVIRASAQGITLEDGTVTGVSWVDADGNQGSMASTQVVVANGLAATQLHGPDSLESLPLRPVHGDILRLTVPPHQRPFLTRTIRGVVRGNPVYLVPRKDNTLVLGATMREDQQTGLSAGGIYQLLRDAHELVPALSELEIHEATARARPGTPDDIPLIGQLTHRGQPITGALLATGFFRHGILLAPWAAQLITRQLTGQTTEQDLADLATCNPYRFAQPDTL
ncbi:glycine oxidase ThiO [Rothia sp. P5766]|uniref:glycine oxidase ThiO n=1 Tax=Rothia sp. P5766 TaxID=3402656 RepID=UPI003AEA8BA9